MKEGDYEKRKGDFVKGFIELTEKTGVSLTSGKFNDMLFLDVNQKKDVKHLFDSDSIQCLWVRDRCS